MSNQSMNMMRKTLLRSDMRLEGLEVVREHKRKPSVNNDDKSRLRQIMRHRYVASVRFTEETRCFGAFSSQQPAMRPT